MTTITHFKVTKNWLIYFLIILSTQGWLFGQAGNLDNPVFRPSSDNFKVGKIAAVSGNGRISNSNIFKMSGKPTSLRMVRGVGGVSFDQVAVPDEHLLKDTISLMYDNSKEDGNRLQLSLGSNKNKYFSASIPDWQLIPIAKYADSEYTALVSLFGQNIAFDKSEIVYHESVFNTLLGLRLFHADLLLADNSGSLWELPQRTTLESPNPIVVFGNGEEEFLPDSTQLKKYNYAFEQIKTIKSYQQSGSYILTDYETEVKFNVSDSLLLISGEPYYLFNSTTIDPQAYLKYIYNYVQEIRHLDTSVIARNKKLDRIEDIYLNERFSWSQQEVEGIVDNLYFYYVEANYLQEIYDELNRIKISHSKRKQFPYEDILDLKELIKTDTTMKVKVMIDSLFKVEQDRAYHEAVNMYYKDWKKVQKDNKKYNSKTRMDIKMDIDSSMIDAHFNKDLKKLHDLYKKSTMRLGRGEEILKNMKNVNLELFFDMQQEVYIHGCLIEGMKANNKHIYNYNPAVMSATIQTMRYAAFFRYVKNNFPQQWEIFLEQIGKHEETVYGNIKTPISYSVEK